MSLIPVCPDPNEQYRLIPSIPARLATSHASLYLGGSVEQRVDIALDSLGSLNIYADSADMSVMRCIPSTISQLLADKFSAIPNVSAVLVGESDGVHHVWVLLQEWTQEHRKNVYAVQRDILQKVRGFNFDFYVVDLPEGTHPSEMVSGIPVIYERN